MPGAGNVGADGALRRSGDAALKKMIQGVDDGLSDDAIVGIDSTDVRVFLRRNIEADITQVVGHSNFDFIDE